MTTQFSLSQPVRSIFWPQANSKLKQTSIVLVWTLLLAISAQLYIPLSPVPITFQSATVVLAGMVLGSRMGLAVVLAYMAAGFLGLPVYAEFTNGWQLLADPSLGYAVGFIPAVALAGFLAERGWAKHFLSSVVTAFAGTAVLLAAGYFWLAHIMSWQQAWLVGVQPFMLTGAIKIIATAWMATKCWKPAA
jgi:biotin transport system substrate-specific component